LCDADDGEVPWNNSIIIKSSTADFADRRLIAAGCGATADRSDRVGNHPSRSGKDDWSAGARGLSWDQVW
jgi:hypothetical protein